jgi:3-methyladenine DNA glycosylase AlkD
MSAQAIVEELKELGRQSYKNVIMKHGVRDPVFGVKIEEMKKIIKREKADNQLALDLYDTGIYDAQYMAGLIADRHMTAADLRKWVNTANCGAIAEITVAWVAAESPHGWELGLEWIEDPNEDVAAAGWSTLGSLVSVTPDSELNLAALEQLIARVEVEIHQASNRVRYTMNGFLIAVGSYVPALTQRAIQAGEKIGTVMVDMGETACKVPFAPDYIRKVEQRGSLGKKRKTAKC